jgi:hypothetical protein
MPELGKKRKGLVCFECGCQADHAHHVVPRVLGGTQTVNLCAPCHAKVHSPHLLRTSELTKAALQKRREQGLTTGGILPYGYTLEENGKLKKNHEEQKIIKQMLKMRNEGLMPKAIGNHFAALGVKNRFGNPMNRKGVQSIFKRYDKNEERSDS